MSSGLNCSYRLQALRAVATKFLDTPTFIGDPATTPLSDQLAALSQELGLLALQKNIAKDELAEVITKSFTGESPTKIIKDPAFEQAENGLKDSLLAIKRKRPFCSTSFLRMD
jgi:hypothetical protein